MTPIDFSVLIGHPEAEFKLTANTISNSLENNHEKINKKIGRDLCFGSAILIENISSFHC